MGKIFINYRRASDAGYTQALYQNLKNEFAADNLFMDVGGHIKPGEDFVKVLNAQVAACDVFLAVIGPRWTEVLRLDDPDDFVVIEIEAALGQDKHVIPVLVHSASMPRADKLPEKIRQLARLNAVFLRPESFEADCQGFIATLKESFEAAERDRAAAKKDRATQDAETGLITALKETLAAVQEGRAGKVVLILGRFLPERKVVLDGLRSELRKPGRDYVPVVLDFARPTTQTTIDILMLLARMARFIIADISHAKSVLMELQAIVHTSPRLPVQSIIVAPQEEPGMFNSFAAYPWFAPVYRFETPAQLLADLDERVIAPAEALAVRFRERKKRPPKKRRSIGVQLASMGISGG